MITFHAITKTNQFLLDRHSSLIRVTAYVLRFINSFTLYKTKHLVAPSKSTLTKLIPFSIDAFPYSGTSQQQKSGQVISSTAAVNPLSISELDCAQKYWIRITQQQEFQKEIHALVHGLPIDSKSKILSLSPYLDPEGILKVGGRLRISELPMDQKHPTILPIHSRLTQLLIEDTHTRNFHAGPQLMISILRRRYWIIRVKDAIRHGISKCTICTKLKAQTLQQMMASLPSFRVKPARPFLKTGIDYAGPFQIRPIQPRSKLTIKAYLLHHSCSTSRGGQ